MAPPEPGRPAALSQRVSVRREDVMDVLKHLADENARHFGRGGWSSYTARLSACCADVGARATEAARLVERAQAVAPRFDVDERTPANGFRSLVGVVDTCVLHLIRLLRDVQQQRASLVFRSSFYCKELEAYAAVLRFLVRAVGRVVEHIDLWPTDTLFPTVDGRQSQVDATLQLMEDVEAMDTSCFYGRAIGFQFCPSVSRIFQLLGVVLATYSVGWEKNRGAVGAFFSSGRYLLSPEHRARRIIKVSREADITFCKGFWSLAEGGMYSQLPAWFCPQLAVNEVIELPIDAPVRLATVGGGSVLIPPPSAHTGVRPVKARLMSYSLRRSMTAGGGANSQSQPPSQSLLLHCHGGGFVATSSKSHEVYLRHWAKLLDCPILSIDYSLAPENPYPRPSQEVFYAYAWALNNADALGWTGERICLAGDSAGANLLTVATLRAIDLGVRRLPDGIVLIYGAFLCEYLPSPSRMLNLMDPLLLQGIVLRCVAAYIGGTEAAEPKTASHVDAPNEHRTLQDYFNEAQSLAPPLRPLPADIAGSEALLAIINSAPPPPPKQPTTPKPITFDFGGAIDEAVENGQETKRARSQCDSLFLDDSTLSSSVSASPSSAAAEEELLDADDDGGGGPTVAIRRDPTRICLTTSVCGDEFLRYLSTNPFTRDSLVVSAGGEEQTGMTAGNKSPLSRSPDVDAPLPSRRSFSQTFGETVALATGHVFDGLATWMGAAPADESRVPTARLQRTQSLATAEAAAADEMPDETVSADMDAFLAELRRRKVPRDAHISPVYASAKQLSMLPPLWIITSHLDPLLDDSVTFARLVRKAGGCVRRVDVLDSLPHGFLNFTLMSAECRQGAKLVLSRIRECLQLP